MAPLFCVGCVFLLQCHCCCFRNTLVFDKSVALTGLWCCLFTVQPVSDLRFKILSESAVQMSWSRPGTRIQGYRVTVSSDTGEDTVKKRGSDPESEKCLSVNSSVFSLFYTNVLRLWHIL